MRERERVMKRKRKIECVCEREKERAMKRKRVCVCVRERERKREGLNKRRVQWMLTRFVKKDNGTNFNF